jgi:hypothetical protein
MQRPYRGALKRLEIEGIRRPREENFAENIEFLVNFQNRDNQKGIPLEE